VDRAQESDITTIDSASAPFVGRWHALVSTTNWEKGRIITQWRQALIARDAPSRDYADDAWSRLVGGVTPQHVGRLRRVYERFGAVFEEYQGLYWSHFHAALDWADAEMWLEGAIQNDWSVSKMRRQRWETLGGNPEDEPQDLDLATHELDDDFVPQDAVEVIELPRSSMRDPLEAGEGPAGESVTVQPPADEAAARKSDEQATEIEAATLQLVHFLHEPPGLPHDLAEAFASFRAAILHHKAVGWTEVAAEDVLASLDALRALVLCSP
jgi:hypothetical protein